MQKIYVSLLFIIAFNFSWAQSENCSGAVALTNGVCVVGTAGVSQNIVGCVGNADDDAWYKFVATSTSHSLTVTGSATYDAVLQIFSGTCAALVSSGCVDNTFNGQAESTVASGLIIGNTYYVRVYHYGVGSGSSTFTMCLNNPPAPPANDPCASAINLAVNAGCINTTGNTYGGTQSLTGCAGTANDDVWYSFTATNYTQTIQVAGSANFDAVVELYSGTCGALSSQSCTDNSFSGGVETVTATGLTPGVTYLFRVYDYYSSAGTTFSVCVSGTSIIAGSQPNDEPCNAIQIPAVTADCNNLIFSNIGATSTALPGSPGAVCENYDNSTNTYGALSNGGYGGTSKDVWFSITVPASGNIYITPSPNQGAGWIQDGVMTLYTGACGALTTYTCSDDYNYPAGYNDLQPFIRATGLTPGSTVYLRYWGYGAAQGNFGFCVQSPTNDLCANALYICDINGYSATTSPAYTRDHPCNMRGNGEGPGPTYSYSVGANPAGPFGAGGTWGTGSAVNDVYIDNNSWVRFTAASPTVSLRVTVYDCWGVGTNSVTATPGTPRGVQMQIFSTTSACCGFTPVSDYKENISGSFVAGVSTYTLNANSLTIGNDYYVMVDGWSGDICNYNIQAIAGVAFPAITAVPGTICPGQSSILTAPTGATGYTWEPGGQTTQTISVAPGTEMTYTCYVGGVCGYKQTLTKTVFLYTVPSVSINTGASIVNCGTQTITLTGGGASTYSWSTGNTSTSFTVAPSGNTTYSVIGTSVNGCSNTAASTVTVNTVPTLSISSTSNTICNGASTNLSVSGASTYTWSPSASLSASTGTAVTASPTITTNYTVVATAANGCTNSAIYTVTVNPKPTVSSTTTGSVICNGSAITLNGTGASSYTWTGGVSDGVSFTPTITTTYTVTGTNATNGCTNTAVRTITVNTPPNISSTTSNSVVCNGTAITLTGTGAITYTWTGGVNNGVSFTPTTTTTYTVNGTAANGCTNTAVRTITVNPLPTVSSTTSNSVICRGTSITLNGTGASTYTWTGGVSNGVAFSTTITSTYTVTGTDGNGCTNTSVRTITVNTIPTSTASTAGTITCVTNTINLNSSLAGQSYTWTAPGGSSISGGTANNQNAIGQGLGTYTLLVLSPAGCSYTTTLAANVNTTTPSASATGGTLTCAQTSTILVGGPISGVTYSWSGPGILGSTTSANVTATVVGTYSLITTSTTNGCSSSSVAIATVTNNLTTPTVTAGSSQTITCIAPTVTLTGSATGGSTLSWSSGATTNTTSVGGSGFYTLTATNPVTGCSATSVVQVVPSAGTPTGTLGTITNSITCTNTTVAISITSTSTPISILWSGTGIAGPTNTASTTVSQGGTYTVTITNTLSSCSQAYPVVVPTNTAPVVASASVSPSASITCNTNSVTLSSVPTGANYTYSWSGPTIISGGTTANPVVGASGNYSVIVTNTITGCTNALGSATVFVPTNTIAPVLNLSATSLTTTCGNPTTTVSVTSNSNPNTTYTWTAPSSGIISNTSISNPTIGGTGVFTVAVTNTVNGCVSANGTVTLTPDVNLPTFNLSSNTATITCAISSPSVTLSSTVTPVTYSWSPTPSSGATTASATFTATGNYICTITNTSNGCSTSAAQVAVGINTTVPSVTITPSNSITCTSTIVTVSSMANPATSTYTWSGTGIIGSVNNSSITVNTSSTYSLSVTDPTNGCINNTVTATVGTNTNAPTLTVAASSSVITCSASNSTLTATPSSTDVVTWTIPSGASASNPVIATTAGDYTATVTDATNGCPASQTITIVSNIVSPNANAGAATVMPCNTSTTTLLGTSTTTDAVSYSWTGPNLGSISAGGNSATPTVTTTGVYTLTVTNLVTGCSATSTVDVSTDNVTADFIADPMIGEIPLTVNFTNTSTGASSYSWIFGNGLTSSSIDPSTVYSNAGTYTVMLIAYSNLCSDTITKTIIAEEGFTIEIPNVFTPNGDGANEAFHIKVTGVKSAEGFIYNRWGQLLYSWDVLNISWDGNASNGENCPDGTYYYLIKVIDKKDKEHLAPGFVLIAR
jgi:gliding motility-associated-like protein